MWRAPDPRSMLYSPAPQLRLVLTRLRLSARYRSYFDDRLENLRQPGLRVPSPTGANRSRSVVFRLVRLPLVGITLTTSVRPILDCTTPETRLRPLPGARMPDGDKGARREPLANCCGRPGACRLTAQAPCAGALYLPSARTASHCFVVKGGVPRSHKLKDEVLLPRTAITGPRT